jgi:hypothetical protein
MKENEMSKEEAALVEAFRNLRTEARHKVLAQVRSALNLEESAQKQSPEPSDLTAAPQLHSPTAV